MSRSQRRLVPLVIVSAVAAGAIVFAQTGHKPSVNPSVLVNTERNPAPLVVVSADSVTRKPLAYYTEGVRSDLFVNPAAPKTEVKKEPVKKPVVLPPAPTIIDPFADFAYSGTVGMNGQLVALVENIKTREGQYLKEGDAFLGGKVSQITDRMVTVTTPTGPKMIAKSDDYKLAPLDKNAAYLQPGQPGQPGTPGQPGDPNAAQAVPGAGAAPGQFPGGGRGNWQNMTDEQRQQMRQRFMNRQFNGGGGGGRRGGRGGFGGGGGGFGGGGGGTYTLGGM